ncbi:hypothetical protein CCR75_008178 [Bremia lactucae]|uniref:Uncharacterized protein n=1 Tax=Bremia lactucae TaxID=4779 RepID=A0A976FMC1_BRELC|nr:hypothetical protein CCR75_008178 [Bremia lactucae]
MGPQRVPFLQATTNAWFGLRLDFLNICATTFVAVFAVVNVNITGSVNPGTLVLTYARPIVGKFNALFTLLSTSERQMIASSECTRTQLSSPKKECKILKSLKQSSKSVANSLSYTSSAALNIVHLPFY